MIEILITERRSFVHGVKTIPSLFLDSDDRVVVGKMNYQPPPEFKKHKMKRITVETLKNETVKEELARRLQRIPVG